VANSDKIPDSRLKVALTAPHRHGLSRLRRWLSMQNDVVAARAHDDAQMTECERSLHMARMHAEAADHLLKAKDSTSLAPVLTLCREALLWALSQNEADKKALSMALESSPHSVQTVTDSGDTRMARLRHLLALHEQPDPGRAGPQEQRKRARTAVESVKALLGQGKPMPGTAEQAVLRTRRTRRTSAALTLFGGLAALALLALWALWPKDLARGKPWHTSSAWRGHHNAPVLFHTNEEPDPWFEVDLLRPRYFHRVVVKNRPECCFERAVPLILEISDDRNRWDEVDQRDSVFTTWETSFPPTQARFVRLRVPRLSILHLEQVQIY
jgi:hypothetical protein